MSVMMVSLYLVELNLDDVKEEWHKTAGPFHIKKIAQHYGVFEHLFGEYARFTPRVKLDIKVSFKISTWRFPKCFYCHFSSIKPMTFTCLFTTATV